MLVRMDRPDPATLRRRLAEVEERLDRIGLRLTAGYGSESDREGWLLWLRQLRSQRDALRAELGEGPAAGSRASADARPAGAGAASERSAPGDPPPTPASPPTAPGS